MLNRNESYTGHFDLGKVPYSRGPYNACGLNRVRIYLHLTWMPENTRRRGYWCFEGVPELMCPNGSTDILTTGMKVFELIEKENWRKYIKEKTLYDELRSMRYWMNNYMYRGTTGQEHLIEEARRNGLLVPGNEAEYLRSIHMDIIGFTGLGYTREYNNESYTYGSDLLVRELPLAIEGVLRDLFKMPSVYRKLNNTKILG